MRAVGVVAEYNPFHNGHAYHLEQAKLLSGAEVAVVVMSGSFTQRGEPAIADKWSRAEMALACGADLVLELPFSCATASAEGFARGAIDILHGISVVTHVAFGCEEPDAELIHSIAALMVNEPAELGERLRDAAASGLPYARAMESALAWCLYGRDMPGLLAAPNAMLGVQYIRRLLELGSSMAPVLVERRGAGHHEPIGTGAGLGGWASASGVRRILGSGTNESCAACLPFVPEATCNVLIRELGRTGAFVSWEALEVALLTLLRRGYDDSAVPARSSEGLTQRLREAVSTARTFEELCAGMKSKRHHRTRIQRLLTHMLVGYTPEEQEAVSAGELWRYARVLGFTPKGRGVLAAMRKESTIPVITSLGEAAAGRPEWASISLDIRATDVHAAANPLPASRAPRQDYRHQVVMA